MHETDTVADEIVHEDGGTAVQPLSRTWKARLIWLLLVVAVIAGDQFTKELILSGVEEGRNIAVVDDLFYITHVRNPGAAFGMFADLPDGWRELVLMSLGGMALLLVVFYSIRLSPREWLSQAALHLIFAGAIGNLLDRFIHGSVTDFILFRHSGWSFPAFNVADSAIVCGVGLLLLDTVLPRKKIKAVETDPAADAIAAGVDLELNGPRPLQIPEDDDDSMNQDGSCADKPAHERS